MGSERMKKIKGRVVINLFSREILAHPLSSRETMDDFPACEWILMEIFVLEGVLY